MKEDNGNNIRFEIPLPFGYHMDLDFLRFCSEDVHGEDLLDRLRDLQSSRKRQRKTLQALMGIKIEQKSREKRLIRDLPQTNRRISPLSSFSPPSTFVKTEYYIDNNHSNDDDHDNNSLKDVVSDFERILNEDSPLEEEYSKHYSDSNSSSISSSTISNSPLMMMMSNSNMNTNMGSTPEDEERPNINTGTGESMETESLTSMTSDLSTCTLKNIREQMAKSLSKLKEYEKQVEVIPLLQVQLSVLKEEKRCLLLKLKQQEYLANTDVSMIEESEEEDLVSKPKRRSSFYHYIDPSRPRARSESPHRILPEIIRSNSCVFKSECCSPVIQLCTSTERSTNTAAPPKSYNQSSNTEAITIFHRGTETKSLFKVVDKSCGPLISSEDLISRDEMEKLIQLAVFKTEEELLNCPCVLKKDVMVQVGEENLLPFVISVALQADFPPSKPLSYESSNQTVFLGKDAEVQTLSQIFQNYTEVKENHQNQNVIMVSVGTETNSHKHRDIGMCTEKWIEVIKASKQTDTEDFLYKDTESPRVADMVFEPSPPPPPSKKSLTSRQSLSPRKQSLRTKSISTMTVDVKPEVKDVSVFAEHPCEKCKSYEEMTFKTLNSERFAPPPGHSPWLSKIPRPILENPDVWKIKGTGNETYKSTIIRSKSSCTMTSPRKFSHPLLSPTFSRRSEIGTPPPHPILSTGLKSFGSADKRSLIPTVSKKTSSSSLSSYSSSKESLIPRMSTPPALRKLYPDTLSMPDRNVIRKNTYTKLTTGVNDPEFSPPLSLFTPINEHRTKVFPSSEMMEALSVIHDSITGSVSPTQTSKLSNSLNIVQQEWFKISSTKSSHPLDVDDYIDYYEGLSSDPRFLHRLVNLTDVNGNTALHYSVSHGNFDVVSVLLDSKVSDTTIVNKAGYTCLMLISLANILNDSHRSVVQRLFARGDVNVRATQHGQTALMLAVSHGRLDMVELLIEAGADSNIRDEDGSTALMVAAEHGHMDIVKILLAHPETDVGAKDHDGLTALAIAMEAGHRDVGVLLYASMSFSRGASPYSSIRVKRPGSLTPTTQSATPTPPYRYRRNSTNQ